MRTALPLLLLLGLLAPACGPAPSEEERAGPARRNFRARQMLMGTFFDIQVVGRDEAAAMVAIGAAFEEVARVERLISEWREDSEISAVNRGAGRGPVSVGPELYTVVERSLRVSGETKSPAVRFRRTRCRARFRCPDRLSRFFGGRAHWSDRGAPSDRDLRRGNQQNLPPCAVDTQRLRR